MAEESTKYHSKRFRVAVEGATSDGRTIERQHIEEMTAGYNDAWHVGPRDRGDLVRRVDAPPVTRSD